jgi:hypothetical protein
LSSLKALVAELSARIFTACSFLYGMGKEQSLIVSLYFFISAIYQLTLAIVPLWSMLRENQNKINSISELE